VAKATFRAIAELRTRKAVRVRRGIAEAAPEAAN